LHLPALFKIELPRQLLRLSPGYPSLAARHASLAAYASADAVLFALRRRPGEPAERRKDLVVALLRMHRSSPHPLWSTLLLLGCAPIVKRLRKDLHGSNPTMRDSILVESFLEVLRSVPTSDPVRIYMYIRQDLRRRVFRALRAELDWRQIGFGEEADLVADGCTSNVPAIVEARLMSERAPDEEARSLLHSLVEPSALREAVDRDYAVCSDDERTRIHERLRKRRHRLVSALRAGRRIPAAKEVSP